MSGHGKRKFRLTAPKNWLRRKYASRHPPQLLSVSIPLEKLPCFSELRLLQLCRMKSGYDGGPPKVSMCVEIKENLEWSVYV